MFGSEDAYDQVGLQCYSNAHFSSHSTLLCVKHTADKHASCETCDRIFASERGLEDHYRDSSRHPNCSWCGAGFEHDSDCEEVSCIFPYE